MSREPEDKKNSGLTLAFERKKNVSAQHTKKIIDRILFKFISISFKSKEKFIRKAEDVPYLLYLGFGFKSLVSDPREAREKYC